MYRYLLIFFIIFAFNLIPFIGPSSLAYIGVTAADFQSLNYIALGLEVGLGATIAKTILLITSTRIYKLLSEKRKRKLQTYANKLGKGGPVLVFLAATILPDDPIIFALGLFKYSPYKFFPVFLFGRTLLMITGAYFGHYIGHGLLYFIPIRELEIISAAIMAILVILFLVQEVKDKNS